jgi:hypothetical protein
VPAESTPETAAKTKSDAPPPPGTKSAPGDGAEGQTPLADSDLLSVPQEFFVFDRNAITLQKSGFEAYTTANYLRNVGLGQKDRAILADATVRYGVADWLELSATVPGYFSERATQLPTSQGALIIGTRNLLSAGDATLAATGRLWNQTADRPGAALTLSAILPTGTSPFLFGTGYRRGNNPMNPFLLTESLGLWGIRSIVQLFKTVDPIVVFAGAGFEHRFPAGIGGHQVDVGTYLLYNAGFSFAFSEKTTLGFQVNGSGQPAFRVDNVPIVTTGEEPIATRMVLIQRIAKELWIEPSLIVGLTSEVPAVILGIGLRARF